MGWVRVPRQFPRECFQSHQSEPEHGPYYEAPDARFQKWHQGVRREYFPYLSRTALRGMLNEPGSPFVPMTHDELIAKDARIEELEAEIIDLQAQLDEFRGAAEVESAESPTAVDVKALASALAEEQARRAAERAAETRAARTARRAARTGD